MQSDAEKVNELLEEFMDASEALLSALSLSTDLGSVVITGDVSNGRTLLNNAMQNYHEWRERQ